MPSSEHRDHPARGWAEVHAVRAVRHMLAEGSENQRPSRTDVSTIAGRVVGLQAQVDSTPPLSVAARDREADRASVQRALGTQALARMWAMRGTLHVVPARDVHLYAAALGDSIAARETRLWPKHGVPSADEDGVIAAIVAALRDGPLAREELADRVAEQLGPAHGTLARHPWGIGLKPAVARGMVGLDGSGRSLMLSLPRRSIQTRIGTVAKPDAQQWLAAKYLDANVVGTAQTFAAWSGLPRPEARAAIDAAADDVTELDATTYATSRRTADETGGAAVRLVPPFDPFVLAVQDKERFVEAGLLSRIYRRAGWVSAVALRDGGPIGTWAFTRRAPKRVDIELFATVDRATRRALDAEAERIEHFVEA